MDLNHSIQTVAIYALPVLFAITVHEAAHGFAARRLGDDTAWLLGRVTLNPLKHIDPVGTILMPLLLYFATVGLPGGPMLFGFAKPVPVDFGNLRNPKRDMVWVALAGPGANLAQALAWGVLFQVLWGAGITEPFFLIMCKAGVAVNVVMAVFNLFPLPPLDGGRILVGLLPRRQSALVSRVEPWGFFVVLALVLGDSMMMRSVGVSFSSLWMRPLMGLTYDFLQLLLSSLAFLLH